MGIFSGLFRSRDKPQNRTAGSSYSFLFGGLTRRGNRAHIHADDGGLLLRPHFSGGCGGTAAQSVSLSVGRRQGEILTIRVPSAPRRAEPGDEFFRIPWNAHDPFAPWATPTRNIRNVKARARSWRYIRWCRTNDSRPRPKRTALLQL